MHTLDRAAAITHANNARLGSLNDLGCMLDAIARDNWNRIVSSDAASVTLGPSHQGLIVTAGQAAGQAFTLPKSLGKGAAFNVVVTTAITSNSTTIKAASADDAFAGVALGVDDDVEGATGFSWNAETGDDTVTMDGTATGGKLGDHWQFIDVAPGLWLVKGFITQSGGAESTPFSATVS